MKHRTGQAETIPGRVSVVVVNFRGVDDTLTCLQRLTELDFPADQLEIICVDNASGDDSVAQLRDRAPEQVVLVESPRNSGFTGGCNLGVQHATGEFVAFINNDAKPDPKWLSEAVNVLRLDSTIGCIASKVLDWDGNDVDFTDAALAWYGMGYKPNAGSPYDGGDETPRDVLFPTGSAMVLRASDFRALDGFDERFFMFYEDVDLGWRLNLLGKRVRYVPTSVVFHKHHQSMREFGQYSEWFLLERNALMMLYKNLSDEGLGRLLAPAMALSVRRSLALGEAETSVLDLEQGLAGDTSETLTVNKRSLAGPYAIDSFLERLPSLAQSRAEIQRTRLRTDRELMPLMRNAIEPAFPNERYLRGHQHLVEAFHIAEWFALRSRILVVTGDPLAAKMAGPAIRAFHIAEELSSEHDVRLISTTSCAITHERFEVGSRTYAGLKADVEWADVVVFQGFLLTHAPWLAKSDKVLVADLYDPMHLEQLEQTRGDEVVSRAKDIASTTEALNLQLRRGDYFICASEKQRHFWLGQLAGVGRLNPRTYDRDPSLSSLLGVVPFGLPSEAPVQSDHPIKGGAFPGIAPTDKVILWAGGVYNWFDPLTLIHAVNRLAATYPEVRLFFLGTAHPNPLVPKMRMVTETRALADSLGLTGKHVFFNEGWVDYNERQNYLLDADVGVSTHFQHIETTFSFRTRVLDYLWAGLPMVVTEGDSFGDLVAERGLGVTVPEQDVAAVEEALRRCLFDEDFAAACRTNIRQVAQEFTWPAVTRPLADFCRDPRRAGDSSSAGLVRGRPVSTTPPVGGSSMDLAKHYLANGGPRELARRVAGRARRMTSNPGTGI
jgi:GT2 family glycosyltransferase/glycosyltransferase involved in cell wall biosynthesis